MSSLEKNNEEEKLMNKIYEKFIKSQEEAKKEFEKTIKEVQDWQKETFGSRISLKGILLKLHEEYEEWQEVVEVIKEKEKEGRVDWNSPENLGIQKRYFEELADFIIVAAEFDLIGSTFGDWLIKLFQIDVVMIETVTDAIKKKLEINKKRDWKTDVEGVSSHDREADKQSSSSERNRGISEAIQN